MNAYVVAGYTIAIVSIAGYSMNLIFRRKALRNRLQKAKLELERISKDNRNDN
jgi:hypothetical protein